jgi:alpha-amylase
MAVGDPALKNVKFAIVIHVHQPIGNLDAVTEHLTLQCYRPFLKTLYEYASIPLTLHVSGPLLLWWEKNDSSMLDLIGDMIGRGQIEPLAGGFFEPILPTLEPRDRRGQIMMMREYLRNRFGVVPRGLWLAERVWDQEIVSDLTTEGIRYVLVDDRHFKVSGFREDELYGYYHTESEGKPLAIFCIDERLRYMVPYQPVDDLVSYLRTIHSQMGSVAVYADDGEKMGGWPGTSDWIYRDGWLSAFLEHLQNFQGDFLDVVTCSQVLEDEESSGICYLPTTSYTEMEGWALPVDRFSSLIELTQRLGDDYSRYESFIRGGHWRHFLVRYPEANLLHKKALHLSRLLQRRDRVPRKIQEDLYAAQCGDAYWHGAYGGIYHPHLRGEAWKRLSRVEKFLRFGEDLSLEVIDIDLDGREEIWAHSHQFSAIVRPDRGGWVSEYSYFPHENNYCNVLARRPEAYHQDTSGVDVIPGADDVVTDRTSPHGFTKRIPSRLRKELWFDDIPRGLFLDRFFNPSGGVGAFQKSQLSEIGDFAHDRFKWRQTGDTVMVEREEKILFGDRPGVLNLQKELIFSEEGEIDLRVVVRFEEIPSELHYGVEISLFPPCIYRGYGTMMVGDREFVPGAGPGAVENADSMLFGDERTISLLRVEWSPVSTLWFHPIHTVTRSLKDFEKILQGITILPHWRLSAANGDTMSMNLRCRFA